MVWTGEPEKTEETPLKKYQRLNCEVGQRYNLDFLCQTLTFRHYILEDLSLF